MTRMVGRGLAATLVVAGVVTGALAGCGGDSSADAPEPTGAVSSSPAALVLSDTGIGELKLGMSVAEAKETGLIGKRVSPTGELCDQYSGNDGVEYAYFSDDELIVIYTDPKIRLDSGIGVGDTYEDLKSAYGDQVLPDAGFARAYVEAPQAPFPTSYRLELSDEYAERDSVIMSIGLEAVNPGCYE